jgi:hypothetical protein
MNLFCLPSTLRESAAIPEKTRFIDEIGHANGIEFEQSRADAARGRDTDKLPP